MCPIEAVIHPKAANRTNISEKMLEIQEQLRIIDNILFVDVQGYIRFKMKLLSVNFIVICIAQQVDCTFLLQSSPVTIKTF